MRSTCVYYHDITSDAGATVSYVTDPATAIIRVNAKGRLDAVVHTLAGEAQVQTCRCLSGICPDMYARKSV